jgi:hypothetical protein
LVAHAPDDSGGCNWCERPGVIIPTIYAYRARHLYQFRRGQILCVVPVAVLLQCYLWQPMAIG